MVLRQMGCRLGQGYGIAKPMPAEQLAEWIDDWKRNAAWLNLDKKPTCEPLT